MNRNLNKLSEQAFDILIIGGGIQGATIADAAARRGLKTALIEKADFCSATSANSLKILHGGFRYLQGMNFRRMRASIRSRNVFMRLAPNLVHPLACVIPTYGLGIRGKYPMKFALMLNDVISWDRNRGIKKHNKIPCGRILSAHRYHELVADHDMNKNSGGAVWYDALVQDTERLTLNVLEKAYRNGACLANYTKAEELCIYKKKIHGVSACDMLSGRHFCIQAAIVVNAAGPWIKELLPFSCVVNRKEWRWARGMNLISRKPLFKDIAVGLEGNSKPSNDNAEYMRRKRFFFFVPWRGFTMIGTAYKQHEDEPDKLHVRRQDIEAFIDEVNVLYPYAGLKYEDISFFHAGLLPVDIQAGNGDDLQLENNAVIIDHKESGNISGLFSVKNVKYTTAPHVAEMLMRYIKIPGKQIKGHGCLQVQSGSSGHDVQITHAEGVTGALVIAALKQKYGARYMQVLSCLADKQELAKPVDADTLVLGAEILHAVRNEMAFNLEDIVFRRTGAGTAACPGMEALTAMADLMGGELGWDDIRKKQQIAGVLSRYVPLISNQIERNLNNDLDA